MTFWGLGLALKRILRFGLHFWGFALLTNGFRGSLQPCVYSQNVCVYYSTANVQVDPLSATTLQQWRVWDHPNDVLSSELCRGQSAVRQYCTSYGSEKIKVLWRFLHISEQVFPEALSC